MTEAWDTSSIEKGLKEAQDRMREGAADGLDKLAHDALKRMQAVTPVRTGALRASGRVVVDREGLKAAVGFGSGSSADYVVVEHESAYPRHTNGQRKFAEVPFVSQVVPTAGQQLAESVKKALS